MIKGLETKKNKLLILLHMPFPTDLFTIIFCFLLTSTSSLKVDERNCMQADFKILHAH